MNIDAQNALDHLRSTVQALDPYADIYVLLADNYGYNQEIEVYILTPKFVDYALEQQYVNARYEAEKSSGQNINMFLYNKSDWHQDHIETPLYEKVHNEGVLL
nr:hypothetical protein [uncultured Carboxylicivirga sp.]